MAILTITAVKVIVPLVVMTVFIARHVYWKWRNNRLWKELGIPTFTGGLRTNYQELIRAQYFRDKDQSYILQTPFHKIIVVPHTRVNEYTWLPEDKVTSAGDLCERFFGDYTYIGSMTPDTPGDRSHISIGFTKTQLTKNVNFIMDDAHTEIEYGLDQIWHSKCNEESWTTLKVHASTTTLYRHVFQRAFVGEELSRNPEWQQLCMEHSPVAMAASVALSKWPWFARPVVAEFLPEMRELRRRFNKLASFIEPLHKKRFEELDSPSFKNPHDLIQHYIEHSGPANAKNTAKMMEAFVIVNFAGIMSTGMVLMQALLDLAARPEYMKPLRCEAQALVSQEGTICLSPTALGKLPLMDSFFKESQRFNHANLLSVYRKTTKQPLALSNGLVIPPEAHIATSNAYSVIGDDGKYREFNGFQWAELRRVKGNEHKYTYVQPGPGAVEFGAGRNACPGRFFATNVMKATLVRLLLQYDFRLPEGQTERPVNKFNNLFAMIPDAEASLEFRKRATATTA